MVLEELDEAQRLLEKIKSWSEEEIKELPKFYREKAREYRELLNPGEQ